MNEIFTQTNSYELSEISLMLSDIIDYLYKLFEFLASSLLIVENTLNSNAGVALEFGKHARKFLYFLLN